MVEWSRLKKKKKMEEDHIIWLNGRVQTKKINQ